jgi:nucleoside-diphosphate-sugar epimerase
VQTDTIFIAGATGFIGNAILQYLVGKGYRVLAMSRSAVQDEQVAAAGAEPVRCHLLSITAEQLSGVSQVVHAAGAVGPAYTDAQMQATNAEGTAHLFDTAKAAGVRQFIYISSDTVALTHADQLEVDEAAAYSSGFGAYVQSKVLAEQYLLEKNRSSTTKVIALRPRLVWGPGDRLQLPLMKQAIEKRKFCWIDHGKSLTSVTYIGNLVHAVGLVAAHPEVPAGAYFVADAEQHTHFGFWTRLLEQEGIKIPNFSLPKWLLKPLAEMTSALAHQFAPGFNPPLSTFTVAIFGSSFTINFNKAYLAFGYQPVYHFEQGLASLKKNS